MESMTPRQRYIETLTFGKPDRVFYDFSWPRQSTMAAWRLQGLPEALTDQAAFRAFVGADGYAGLPIRTNAWPVFEERIIKEEHGQRIWVDTLGIKMVDAGKSLGTPGFRTRTYLEHPVKNRDDWLRMRDEHMDPLHPERYPDPWNKTVAALKDHEAPVRIVIPGLYWKTRDFVGFEQLSMMFYDNPKLVHEMMEHMTHFIVTLLERAVTDVEVDCVLLNEDMGYKTALMISPATYREFMLPRYQRIARFLMDHNVPVRAVDSDGHVGQLIPLLIEAGFNAVQPVEIAANNDPVAFRKQYGNRIAFWSAIDKREITTREKTYAEVMGKVPWLIEQGGYYPGIDHGVPPTVHLRGYLYMVELIKAIAEGRPAPGPEDPLELEASLGPIEKMWTPDMAILDHEDES